jgi:lipid II:glycine glycyltransferase (peptidoglycan interpeptide bridge formation enzyme)
MITWCTDLPPVQWDAHVAALGGHPLQTALWGEARRAVDGIEDHRWAAFDGDRAVLLARCEVRRIPPFWRVAWLPRGPVWERAAPSPDAFTDFCDRLRSTGFVLCIDDCYQGGGGGQGVALLPRPRTAWVDLTGGHDAVWKAIDQQWRYGVRSAGRYGIVVEQTSVPADATAFFSLCERVSRRKGFDLPGSAELLQMLLCGSISPDAGAHLFVARFKSAIVGGAAVLRCGQSLHYFWGAVDRAFAKQRPGEAVHGAIIDWALGQGIARYDLEGIDPVQNPGTYRFKMKMGAVAVTLPGRRAYPLRPLGRVMLSVGQRLGRL